MYFIKKLFCNKITEKVLCAATAKLFPRYDERRVLLQLFSATHTRIPLKNAVLMLGMYLNTAPKLNQRSSRFYSGMRERLHLVQRGSKLVRQSWRHNALWGCVLLLTPYALGPVNQIQR